MPPKLPDSMPWQIYQAYLHGPHALFRLFEESFGRVALHGTPDPDVQQRMIDDLGAHISRLTAQLEKLQTEVRDLRHRNFQLGRRNAELEVIGMSDAGATIASALQIALRNASGRAVPLNDE